jgi:hypothetical protein
VSVDFGEARFILSIAVTAVAIRTDKASTPFHELGYIDDRRAATGQFRHAVPPIGRQFECPEQVGNLVIDDVRHEGMPVGAALERVAFAVHRRTMAMAV